MFVQFCPNFRQTTVNNFLYKIADSYCSNTIFCCCPFMFSWELMHREPSGARIVSGQQHLPSTPQMVAGRPWVGGRCRGGAQAASPQPACSAPPLAHSQGYGGRTATTQEPGPQERGRGGSLWSGVLLSYLIFQPYPAHTLCLPVVPNGL